MGEYKLSYLELLCKHDDTLDLKFDNLSNAEIMDMIQNIKLMKECPHNDQVHECDFKCEKCYHASLLTKSNGFMHYI